MNISSSFSLKKTIFITIALVGIQLLSFGQTITSTITGGAWNAGATWVGGVVPVLANDVVIATTLGSTVTLTTNQPCNSLTVNAGSILNLNTNASTLTITNGLTLLGTGLIQGTGASRAINVGGAFSVPSLQTPTVQDIALAVSGATQIDGTLTFNTGSTAAKSFASVTISGTGTFTNTSNNVPISISGDFINSGTFSQGTGRVTFTGATSNIIAGISTSAFGGGITVNKGASQANILDVQSLITMSNGGLTLTSGTFKLTSASTIVPFTSDPRFGSNSRLWCNGGTMNSTASIRWRFSGTLQISAGTVNHGIAIDDLLVPFNAGAVGTVNVSGGALNVAGRITGQGADWNYVMSGGVLTAGTFGATSFWIFDMSTTTSTFNMTGGTIIVERPNGTQGYLNSATGGTFTGGALQIGDASTPAASTIGIDTTVPIFNLLVNSANANAQVQTQAITVSNNVTISSGTLTANNLGISVAGNWTNNGTFTPGTATVTFNSTTASQTVGGTSSTSFNNLTLNNTFATSPQIVLGINTTAVNQLTMTSGIVNLAGFTFTLGASATASTLARTASATTNWMYGGTFKRFWLNATAISSTAGNFYGLFPVGAATASSYRPVEINSTLNPTATGSYSVTHTDATTSTDLAPTFLDGVTTVLRKNDAQFVTLISGVTGGTYNINVTMTGLLAGTLSDIRLVVSTGATTAGIVGTHTGATGSAPNPTAGRTGLSLANLSGDFRIATSNSVATPLPIELLSFSGEAKKFGVVLKWETASEINNNSFTVLHSSSGDSFVPIGIVQGSGTTHQAHTYTLTDHKPAIGKNYYQLSQTDFDGLSTTTKIIAVDVTSLDDLVKIYPIPVSKDQQLTIEINGLQANTPSQIQILNGQGATVSTATITTDADGTLSVSFSPAAFASGLHVLRAHGLSYKFIVE